MRSYAGRRRQPAHRRGRRRPGRCGSSRAGRGRRRRSRRAAARRARRPASLPETRLRHGTDPNPEPSLHTCGSCTRPTRMQRLLCCPQARSPTSTTGGHRLHPVAMPYAPQTREVLRLSEAVQLHGRSAVRWAVAEGRWQRPHPRVVVAHNGPFTADDELRIAVTAGPSGTLLAGPTAAALWGLRGFDTAGLFHVVVPHNARHFAYPGVVLHRSIALEREPGTGDPPRVSVERSIIDTASWSLSPRRCRVIILAAVQQRLTTVPLLTSSLHERGPMRHARILRESLLDAAGGIDSLPELDFARLLAIHGLPEPRRQVRVRGPGGGYFLDAEFLALACDGRGRWGSPPRRPAERG